MSLRTDPSPPSALPFVEELVRTQGDIARFDNARGPVHFFNHPDHVQAVLQNPEFIRTALFRMVLGNGLLASDGDVWRRRRRIIQPSFGEHRVASYGDAVVRHTLALLDRWARGPMRTGEPFDVAIEMRRLTLEIVVSALFGVDLGEDAARFDEAFSRVIDEVSAIARGAFNVAPPVFTPQRQAEFRSALAALHAYVDRLIADRRHVESRPADLLTALIETADDATGRPLDHADIRDEILTMLIAGHETTAVALAWLWWVLTRHPDVERQVIVELDERLGARTPTAADMPALDYTRGVIQEVLRLYPPVTFTMRQAVSPQQIAGVPIPRGGLVLLCAWTTHRHAAFWPDPDRFDPERFVRAASRHHYAYFPFGGGRHLCIGQSFALLEAQLILAIVLQRVRIRPAGAVEPEPDPAITLRQKHGFLVTAVARDDSTAVG
ncbi:MAG: cytochrome P450 [Acidobacteria bacterium]|nr:cytochrome P450 [Acidobacteriota bacterium]